MSCCPNNQPEMPVEVRATSCRCGEEAFLISSHFVSWEQCTFCEHRRTVAWTSWQTPAIVLGGAQHAGA